MKDHRVPGFALYDKNGAPPEKVGAVSSLNKLNSLVRDYLLEHVDGFLRTLHGDVDYRFAAFFGF